MAIDTTAPMPISDSAVPARQGQRIEVIGYGVIAVVLAALLWLRVRHVDGFFLDEWFYTGGAQYMWDHLPFGPVGDIPLWNRGPQRLYSFLLMFAYGPLSPSGAFTAGHLMNVVLAASAVVPAALLARAVIAEPWMRVLAVALAVVIPWLSISAHLLTENLTFPLFLWTAYAILRTAEDPALRHQILALGAIAGLTLCRLAFAVVFGALICAVLAAEIRDRTPLREAIRRRALLVAATVGAVIVGGTVIAGGSTTLGAYGGLDSGTIIDRLVGGDSEATRRGALVYLRGIVNGTFVFPFLLGLGVALAGTCGRLGRALVVPCVIALSSFVLVLVAVSVFTWNAPLEERYVFPAYPPLAILAVAGIRALPRIRGWIAASGSITVWSLYAGFPSAAVDAGHFFAAPGGAFWTKVVDHRLRAYEEDFFGWLFIPPTGWFLIAVGILAMLAFLGIGRALVTPVIAAGLALCAVAQAAVMDYDLKQELYGTRDVPGGLARGPDRTQDRDDFADRAIPNGEAAAIIPALATTPYGEAERVEFWNRDITIAAAIVWNSTPTPASPGFSSVTLVPADDGLARFDRPVASHLVTQGDDPRVQFPGEVVGRSMTLPYVVKRVDTSKRAQWTSVGVDYDGAVSENRPVTMVLDGSVRPTVRTVTLKLVAAAGATKPVRWRIRKDGDTVSAGVVPAGATRSVRLRVSRCRAQGQCLRTWKLTTSGPTTPIPPPAYGAAPPPRPIHLMLVSARLD